MNRPAAFVLAMVAHLEQAVERRDARSLARRAGDAWRQNFDFSEVPEETMRATSQDLSDASTRAKDGEWGLVQAALGRIKERWSLGQTSIGFGGDEHRKGRKRPRVTSDLKEFDGNDLVEARAFIEAFSEEYRRVYVEVWDEEIGRWRFSYAADRRFAHELLEAVTRGRRFRVHGAEGY